MSYLDEEWQPIDTVPADKKVLIGKWCIHGEDKLFWSINEQIVKKTKIGWFGDKFEFTHHYEMYTHWKPLPPAPRANESWDIKMKPPKEESE